MGIFFFPVFLLPLYPISQFHKFYYNFITLISLQPHVPLRYCQIRIRSKKFLGTKVLTLTVKKFVTLVTTLDGHKVINVVKGIILITIFSSVLSLSCKEDVRRTPRLTPIADCWYFFADFAIAENFWKKSAK